MCKKINRFFPILMAFYFGMSFAVGIIMGMLGIRIPMWASCVMSESFLLIPGLFYAGINKINVVKFLPYRKIRPVDVILSILTGYMLVPCVMFINLLTSFFSVNHLEQSVSDITSYPFIAQIFLMAVIPPMVEEFVFRGLFYHSYRKNGLVAAAILSAMAFGIIHLNLNQFFYAFFAGIVFAALVEATGSMWASMCAHFAFNTYSIGMIQIAKMLGYGTADVNYDTAASSAEVAMITVVTKIVALIIVGSMAVGFLFLIKITISKMAKRNDRYEYMKNVCGMKFKSLNGEKTLTLPYIFTAIVGFAYMIFYEFML